MPAFVTAIAAAPQKRNTGPRSEAGKERSSRNATLHGGASDKLILPGEKESEFHALWNGLRTEYQPGTEQSEIFVEQLALAHWFLWRRQRAYAAIEAAVYQSEPDETKWTAEHLHRLALADRYRTQAERALKRALVNIEGWRKTNRSDADREQRNARWEAEQRIRERRITLQENTQAIRFAKNAVSSPSVAAPTVEIIESEPELAPDNTSESPVPKRNEAKTR